MDASKTPFPVVAIGASAGGIEALEGFFRTMPADCGMAFVIVTHLSPDHPSLLHEIVARFTSMHVHVAHDGAPVAINEVFVMSENRLLGIKNGRLSVRPGIRSERKPVDLFFAELALDRGEYSCGVVLSGGDGDGSTGIKAIKERGGLTLAQASAGDGPRHSDMPTSAIATGQVDFAIPVEAMAETLMRHAKSFALFWDDLESDEAATDTVRIVAQREIYALLRNQIGHDFSGYKARTFNRRVHRRMQVLQLFSIEAYVERLKQDAAELTALFCDLLINVTGFFRDPEAFEALRLSVIPKMFEGKGADDTVRVWVPGCATGEEVFSIAILLREYADTLRGVPTVQIFATDIDETSLAVARAARYPTRFLEGISPERMRRFFTQDGGELVLTKEIRDLCIFSPHSVIRDPPFSRMDLVSCRNLLIYFGLEVQAQVIPTFHYALRPAGYLFLGTSENISQFGELFMAVDKKQRLFQCRDEERSRHPVPIVIKNLHASLRADPTHRGKPLNGTPLRALVEAFVMERFAAPHVVVNVDGDIVYFSPRTGRYLEAAPGAPSRHLLSTARKGLRLDLRTGLREVVETRRLVTRPNIVVDTDDDRVQIVTLTLDTIPRRVGEEQLFIVLFMDNGLSLTREEALVRVHGQQDDSVLLMERELRESRERLQSMLEEYETALEELKSSNEELVSVNEELQSTNEELESSKEELQSLNEELHTVNGELSMKVDALDHANADLHNLFESTQIATVFLDHDLAIRNFTPPFSRLFNVLPSDKGRLLSDFASRLNYPTFNDDIRKTLVSGEPVEQRADTGRGEHFIARIRAYRDAEKTIQGVICTFLDVTILAESEARQRQLVEQLALRLANDTEGMTNVLVREQVGGKKT